MNFVFVCVFLKQQKGSVVSASMGRTKVSNRKKTTTAPTKKKPVAVAVHIVPPRDEPIFDPEKTYWNNKGRYQELSSQLSDGLTKVVTNWNDNLQSDEEKQQRKWGYVSWFWKNNPRWALLNAMMGIYYGFFNDGDSPKGAIENNRCHSFESLSDFRSFCAHNAPEDVLDYLDGFGSATHRRQLQALEEAMDATVLFSKDLLSTVPVEEEPKKGE